MYRLFKGVSICCFVLAGVAVNAGAASFDCSRAGRPAEKLVCADKGLSTLDSVLARLHAKRQEVVVDPAITAADTASGNVLQRITDKLPSGGITIRGLRFDTKDYTALLHAPSFGLLTEYANATGCDDNYGTGFRVYSQIGQAIVPVIRDIVM